MRVILNIEVYDFIMEMPQYIPVDITDEIQAIYPDVELTKDFIKEIETQFKKVIGNNAVVMKYSDKKEWVLDRKVKELFFNDF